MSFPPTHPNTLGGVRVEELMIHAASSLLIKPCKQPMFKRLTLIQILKAWTDESYSKASQQDDL